jgi:hypothetical protein
MNDLDAIFVYSTAARSAALLRNIRLIELTLGTLLDVQTPEGEKSKLNTYVRMKASNNISLK